MTSDYDPKLPNPPGWRCRSGYVLCRQSKLEDTILIPQKDSDGGRWCDCRLPNECRRAIGVSANSLQIPATNVTRGQAEARAKEIEDGLRSMGVLDNLESYFDGYGTWVIALEDRKLVVYDAKEWSDRKGIPLATNGQLAGGKE